MKGGDVPSALLGAGDIALIRPRKRANKSIAPISIVANEKGIDPALVEKDYWIMHGLYGLQQLDLTFELKGGTSLSKGFQMIDRFSEDIDIRIEPPPEQDVKTRKNQTKPAHRQSRANFYDYLTKTIRIDGTVLVERDTSVDNKDLFSAGIRLSYKTTTPPIEGLREGVLLEAGFAQVTPNEPKDISSWAYDYAASRVDIIDNRAKGVACYDAGYTLVEKLQTISTKYRTRKEGQTPVEVMRHYYDVYSLLQQRRCRHSWAQLPTSSIRKTIFPKRTIRTFG